MEGLTGSMYRMVSTMNQEFKRQETIARNLAASCNPGFKKEFIVSGNSFGDELNKSLNTKGDKGKVVIDYTQGNLSSTGRNLDFAIQGDGFFEVKTKEGKTQYTRNGAFFASKDGHLITQEGHVVSGSVGDLRFTISDNLDTLRTTEDGQLRVTGGQETNFAQKNIGKIKIVDIADKKKLKRFSANYFTIEEEDKSEMKPVDPKKYKMQNTYLEMSNSTPISDMTAMIQSQRDFDMGQRLIKSLEDINQQELRKLV